jgi:hypothetical protein
MRRKPDNFPLVLAGGGLGLWILFHTIWNILFEDWLKHQLEHLVRHTLAEIIERFGSVGFPALAAIAVVWFLSSYISAQTKAEFAAQSELQSRPEAVARKAPAFDNSWTRDVTMLDALWRAFFGEWEVRPQFSPLDHSSPEVLRLWAIGDRLRQQAFEGELPVWGRRRSRPPSNLYEQIPETFWSNHAIDCGYSASSKAQHFWVYVTHPLVVGEVPNARTLAWEDFMTSKTAVDKLWPKSSAPSPREV